MRAILAGFATLTLVAAAPGIASAGPADRGPAGAPPSHSESAGHHQGHNLPSPLSKKQSALRTKAQQMVLEGTAQPMAAKAGDKVVKVAPGQFVELAREDEDLIFTVTGEFGDEVATHDHGEAGSITHEGPAGPLHNEIPKPDRSVDNTTIWTEDFSQEYYEELLFSKEDGANSMANFYIEQSSNRYTVDGDVTDWAQVPYNAASYGSNYCGGIVCQDTWFFVQDSLNAWYQRQLASGKSTAEIDEYLSQFDQWDRYDHDGDGDFDEPDGYIDHFQSVHAGVGEETGGGEQGTDAIWSHRWYVQTTGIGDGGPEGNPLGGTQIGDSKYWVGDYTIEPENGGVGVFAHEFAHDLGLPDLYDTSGNEGGAENSTAFWTLMSSGSYGSSGVPEDGIGTKPMHMGNWEKFQLGWLDYETFQAGEKGKVKLGPAEYTTKKAQGAFVLLPDKVVPLELGEPFAGENFYYSESGDNLDNSMTKQVTVPDSGALTAQARYDIEQDWDYAYLTVNGESVETSLSTTEDPNGGNRGFGITGDSGGEWVELTADLSQWAGESVDLGFRYVTDGAVTEPGFQVDQIELGGDLIGSAETDEGWTFAGFRTTTGSEEQEFFNAYVLANRQYLGYDESLRTGPYNFGFLDSRPNWVEHFPYQDGLLINYWDSSYADNNVGDHPGGGLVLPVDAHPRIMHWRDGTMMRPRLQSFDSTFGLEPTPRLTLHNNGVPKRIGPKRAVSVFDDSRQGHWWSNCDRHACTGEHEGHYQPGWSSADVPDTGTTVEVVNTSGRDGTFMQVEVNGKQ